MAASSDLLYVSTGLQSFEDGFLGTIDTSSRTPGVLMLTHSDHRSVLVDPANSNRVFVATADRFADDGPLQVYLFDQGRLIGSAQVLESFSDTIVRGMAYDPDYALLFVAVEDQIHVLRL